LLYHYLLMIPLNPPCKGGRRRFWKFKAVTWQDGE
jgi:hypothetical protein